MFKINVILALLLQVSAPAINAAAQPNIVFILADDLGYGELGCYGQEKIKTPNIDQLAAEGMKFNYHYSGAPVCGPARCVLLTGKNLAHAEVRDNGEIKTKPKGKKKFFGGQTPLTPAAVTIAEALKGQGYATGGFGKWGLGATWSTGSPIKQGFDRFYGYNCQRNAHSFYPAYLDSDEEQVSINKHPIPGHKHQPKGEVLADTYRAENYAPDLILDEAVKFIDANKAKPFFLYLPFVEPHVAMQPHQEDIDKYPTSWDTKAYRGQHGYLPHPRPRAGYAAMITDLDNHVGTIVAKLKAEGIYDNTLVIFTSDNGATTDKGGADTQFFKSVKDLRGRKGSAYEGGLRVPLIVRWKGHIKAGTTSDTLSYFPDWFPTLTAIAGGDVLKAPKDGINLVPAFSGKPVATRDEPMFWEFHGYGGIIAVRDGNWKAIRRGIKSKKIKNWELYNIEADPQEKYDLAKQNPERVQQLEKSWLTSRSVNKNFPLPLVDKK